MRLTKWPDTTLFSSVHTTSLQLEPGNLVSTHALDRRSQTWNETENGLVIIMYMITMIIGHSNKRVQVQVKVALSQKILEKFYVSNINIPNHYPEQKIWISCLLLGRKFKFSAQDSELEYLCWRCKNSPVSSDLKLKVSWFHNVLLMSLFGQKYQRFFSRISALASKKRSNQKSSVRELK